MLALKKAPLIVLLAIFLLEGCSFMNTIHPANNPGVPHLDERSFGVTKEGRTVYEYILTNSTGMRISILTLGGILRTIEVPDRSGANADIALGFDTLPSYEERHPYFGTITGRFANRIAKGTFSLDGQTYTLATNNCPNHLHGGLKGFDRAIWNTKTETTATFARVSLTHVSPDMDEGYPGEVSTEVTYTLTNDNEIWIAYRATTTKPTPINLTNHTYFNLTGDASRDIKDHVLEIDAEEIVPVDENSIPTGSLMPVKNTSFDFRKPHPLGERINDVGIGYDHTYVLSSGTRELSFAARLVDPKSGRVLVVLTTAPGVQLYTGNYLNGTFKGKGGVSYGKHAGLCLETQHFPDSVNQPSFPSTILRPGETYAQTTVYRFGIER